MTKSIIGLSESALAKLAENFAAQSTSSDAAGLYLDAILEVYPKIKLPQLLVLEETKELMADYSISENKLSTQLTRARARRKAGKPEPTIKIPRRKRRSKTKDEGAKSTRSSPDLLTNVSANSPSPSGRIENGNIDDL